MRYSNLGKTNLKVPAVTLGTWVLGGMMWGPVEDENGIAAIHASMDNGVTMIDTAPVYGWGHSESLIGEALKSYDKKGPGDIVIATKCGLRKTGPNYLVDIANDLSPAFIRSDLSGSLERLGVDTIHLYQCHWPDPSTRIEDTMDELMSIKDEGKINHIGVSNFNVALLERARERAEVVSLQPQYSLLDRRIENELLPYCRQHNIGVLAYAPLGGGILTGKYTERPEFRNDDARSFFYPYYREPYWSKVQELLAVMSRIAEGHACVVAEVAINWVCQQPGVTSAIVGARTPRQACANTKAGDWTLSGNELFELTEACDNIFR